MKAKLVPLAVYVGAAFITVMACSALGLPPLWGGVIAGTVGAHLARK